MPEYDFNLGIGPTPELERQGSDQVDPRIYEQLLKIYNAVNVLASEVQDISNRLTAAGIP